MPAISAIASWCDWRALQPGLAGRGGGGTMGAVARLTEENRAERAMKLKEIQARQADNDDEFVRGCSCNGTQMFKLSWVPYPVRVTRRKQVLWH